MPFDDPTAFTDPAVADAALFAYGFATEAAGNAAALAEGWGRDTALPAAQAAAGWLTGPGLDYLADAAGPAADGFLDAFADTVDDIMAITVGGGPIDATRVRYHGHPHAIDRPYRRRA